MPRIVLASQSTSRKRLLEGAGLKPTIIVSNVDEETDHFNAMSPADMVIALAISKAHTVRCRAAVGEEQAREPVADAARALAVLGQ